MGRVQKFAGPGWVSVGEARGSTGAPPIMVACHTVSRMAGAAGEVGSALSPVEMMKRFLGGAAPPPPRAAEESELEALRKRISELEARIHNKEEEKRRSPKKAQRGYNRRRKLHTE